MGVQMRRRWPVHSVSRASPRRSSGCRNNDVLHRGRAPVATARRRVQCRSLCMRTSSASERLPMDIPKIVTAHSDVLSWAEACRDDALQESAWLRSTLACCEWPRGGRCRDCSDALDAGCARRRIFQCREKQHVIPNGRSLSSRYQKDRKLQADHGRPACGTRQRESSCSRGAFADADSAGWRDSFESRRNRLVESANAQLVGALSPEALLSLFCESAIYMCHFAIRTVRPGTAGSGTVRLCRGRNDIPSLREVWADGAIYFRECRCVSNVC